MHPGAGQELVTDCTVRDVPYRKVVASTENGLALVHFCVGNNKMDRCQWGAGIVSGEQMRHRLTGCLPRWWKWAGININAACWHYCIAVNFFCWGVQRTLKICSLWHKPLAIPSWKWFALVWAKENADDEWLVIGGQPLYGFDIDLR